MAAPEELGPVFGTPEYALAMAHRELGAYPTFAAITDELDVRRVVRRHGLPQSQVPLGRTTVYQPIPITVDRHTWGQPVVALSVVKHEIAPSHMSMEAELLGDDYFDGSLDIDVVPQIIVLDTINSARAQAVEQYRRPAVALRRSCEGLEPVEIADFGFLFAEPAIAELEQEGYMHWLSRLAVRVVPG